MKLTIVKAAALLSLLSAVVNSKVATCITDLTVDRDWQYCTKMAFGKDKLAKVKATVEYSDVHKTEQPEHVQLFVFNENQWGTILKNEDDSGSQATCDKMSNSAQYRESVFFETSDGTVNSTDFQNIVQDRS